MSKIVSTCGAETVLLLGSTASSSRTLCNASAGDAQVMLEELCRCTAMIVHLSIFLPSALISVSTYSVYHHIGIRPWSLKSEKRRVPTRKCFSVGYASDLQSYSGPWARERQ